MRVNFVIAGTHKGGTTALDDCLRGHPGIRMARHKEIHFFDNDRNFKGGMPDYARYHAFFPHAAGTVRGEATPNYMYHPDAPRRVRDYNPAMKIILLLRNPAERAHSHWNMERHHGVEPRPLLEALRREMAARALPPERRDWRLTYLSRGFYSEQIRRLWAQFPREQVLILRSESLRREPDKTLAEIQAFLGVAPMRLASKEIHALPYTAPLGREERAFLSSVFTAEIQELERMLGWDCGDWQRWADSAM